MRPLASATASEMVLPFTRFNACGRLRSLRRSHSQDDSREGLPNRSRKPSLPTCGSVTCSARVSGGASGNDRAHAGGQRQRVHQFLRAQPPRHGVREIVGVVLVPLVGRDAGLIGARIGDGAHQLPQIEIVIHEILGQRVEQRRIAGRIGRADIVHRIDDAAPEEVAPHAVDGGLREERIVPRGQPLGVGHAAARHRSVGTAASPE